MHNWWYIHGAFLTRSSKDFKEKSCCSKTFGFFSNKLSLDQWISSCFFMAYFILSESNSYAVNGNNLLPYILSSELQCLLHGDSRNLCTNTRVQLLATHSLCHYKNSRTSSKILNHFLFWRSCTYFMSEKWRKKPQCWELK